MNSSMIALSGVPFFMILWGAITLIAHFMLAMAVYQDGKRIEAGTGSTMFVNSLLWAFLIFLSGVIGTGVYWVIHHSNLRERRG